MKNSCKSCGIHNIRTKECQKISENKGQFQATGENSIQHEHNLRKTCANLRHRSAYLKRYAYKTGPKYEPCFRNAKCKYTVPAMHVTRRPDNPYNVKNIVEILKKDQSKEESTPKHQSSINDITYCE